MLDGEPDLSIVDGKNFDSDYVVVLQIVVHVVYIRIGNFGNVDKTCSAFTDINERPKLRDTCDAALNNGTDLD